MTFGRPPHRHIPPEKPDEEAEKIGRMFLCVIARSPDGVVSLTVFEDGRAATLETNAAGAQMLADMLTGKR